MILVFDKNHCGVNLKKEI